MVWPDSGGDDVAGLVGVRVRQVLAGRHEADHVELQAQFADGAEGAQYRAAAAHVVIHLVHVARRLERYAAGIEGDGLADQHDGLVALLAAVMAQFDEHRRLVAALGHREEGAHAEFFTGGLVHHLALETVGLGQLPGLIREISRRADVGRRVAEVARQRHAAGDGGAPLQGSGGGVGRQKGDAGKPGLVVGLAFHAVEAVDRVRRHDRGLFQVPAGAALADLDFVERDEHILRGGAGGSLYGCRHRVAVSFLCEPVLFAKADEQHALGGNAGQVAQQQGAAGAAVHVAALEDCGDAATGGPVQSAGGGGKLAAIEYAGNDAGAFEFLGRSGFYAKFRCIIFC